MPSHKTRAYSPKKDKPKVINSRAPPFASPKPKTEVNSSLPMFTPEFAALPFVSSLANGKGARKARESPRKVKSFPSPQSAFARNEITVSGKALMEFLSSFQFSPSDSRSAIVAE